MIMSDSQKNSQPPDKLQEAVLDKIGVLEKKIENIDKVKRITSAATYIGLILIIVFFAFFIFSLIYFVKAYDTQALAVALHSHAVKLARSDEVRAELQQVKEKFVPAYNVALIAKIKKDKPLFQESTKELAKDLQNYLRCNVKPKLANSLVEKLALSESLMLTTNSATKLPRERIEKIVSISKEFFRTGVTDSLNVKLNSALMAFTSLNSSFQKMYDSMEGTSVLKGLTPEMTGEVQSRLVETMLELMIYRLNPQKGDMPAFADGGAK